MPRPSKARNRHAQTVPVFLRRPPDWRSQLASDLASRGESDHPDPLVVRLSRFLRDANENRQLALETDPELASAVAFEQQTQQLQTIKVLLISATPLEEIAASLELPPVQIEMWRDLYFDVAGRLQHPGWVAAHVIGPEEEAGRRIFADRLRLAYGGGPLMAAALLKEANGLAIGRDEEIQLLQLRLQMKMRAAVRLPVKTPAQAGKIMEASVAVQRLAAEIEFTRERLANQERQSQRYHDESMIRLQSDYVKAVTQAKSLGIDIDGHLSQFTVAAAPLAEGNEPTILAMDAGGSATSEITRASGSADVLAPDSAWIKQRVGQGYCDVAPQSRLGTRSEESAAIIVGPWQKTPCSYDVTKHRTARGA